ncbi:undecaprenyldiphospho-muramoylpentapeptide beta-N-acetylglucosaminyltransferase [Oleiagrimonas sp.]|jgi:UDP-N-acetylglucosamine--N-acetylmuramyl-(pentapeptide) pyrophosphoryl-undecaprenol N-acetylglucosamine transferase|uniref:undecaprenyldiphospho-muramoylpentapeptide beta-N-acetylglucosaminyltransferase n=1 Tax=Oleiagrimonas sp. TaxID=2010330 RepID=UPI002634FBF8|nr:undecaprenyldiphospho-muramoylpentapeptide beta-N-acetylglucosaminyltransferase [Oleiagrimonas sp.]MDA3915203.1 undecaprenyldiphospho-muramoylpentapeptide beta-N-acetylglucosaminyltransferase [Oleiagrimonas sp.]
MSTDAPVLIMAGGTGGHIFPGLAVACALRERGVAVAWLGAVGGLETRLVAAHAIQMHTVRIGGLRGKGLATRLVAPFVLARAVLAARAVLRRVRPRCVLSMGGYVAGPGGLAAWMSRCPLLVHEQNCVPGITNRVLARLAAKVMAGFDGAFPARIDAEWVGNPVRDDIAALSPPAQRMAGRQGPLRLLVLGGSQGARALNRVVPEALRELPMNQRPEVLHQCGERDLEGARSAYAEAGVQARVQPFIENMSESYAWADLAVCRAGALTLAELSAAGLGAVLVPYPFAVDDHQSRNAQALCEVGAAELVQERDLDPALLSRKLNQLLSDRERLLSMAIAARRLARADAAQTIAGYCLEEAA